MADSCLPSPMPGPDSAGLGETERGCSDSFGNPFSNIRSADKLRGARPCIPGVFSKEAMPRMSLRDPKMLFLPEPSQGEYSAPPGRPQGPGGRCEFPPPPLRISQDQTRWCTENIQERAAAAAPANRVTTRCEQQDRLSGEPDTRLQIEAASGSAAKEHLQKPGLLQSSEASQPKPPASGLREAAQVSAWVRMGWGRA